MLPVVRTCPLKVRVIQGWIRVKGLLMMGICKYVWVGFILEQLGCNGKQVRSRFGHYYLQ